MWSITCYSVVSAGRYQTGNQYNKPLHTAAAQLTRSTNHEKVTMLNNTATTPDNTATDVQAPTRTGKRAARKSAAAPATKQEQVNTLVTSLLDTIATVDSNITTAREQIANLLKSYYKLQSRLHGDVRPLEALIVVANKSGANHVALRRYILKTVEAVEYKNGKSGVIHLLRNNGKSEKLVPIADSTWAEWDVVAAPRPIQIEEQTMEALTDEMVQTAIEAANKAAQAAFLKHATQFYAALAPVDQTAANVTKIERRFKLPKNLLADKLCKAAKQTTAVA